MKRSYVSAVTTAWPTSRHSAKAQRRPQSPDRHRGVRSDWHCLAAVAKVPGRHLLQRRDLITYWPIGGTPDYRVVTLHYNQVVDTAETLYQPTGRSPLAVFLGLISLLGLLPLLFSVARFDWAESVGNLVFFAIFGGGAYWVYSRRRRTGVYLANNHLISRDGTGQDTQIPIDDAVVELTEVSAGTSIAPMTRTLKLPDSDGIPSQKVLVVRHAGVITELFQVRGMTPPKLRALRDDINAQLDRARAAAGLPPVGPGYGL